MKVVFIERVKYKGEVIEMESYGKFDNIPDVEEFIAHFNESQDVVEIIEWYDLSITESLISLV